MCVASYVSSKQDHHHWMKQRRLLQHANRCGFLIRNGITSEISGALYDLGHFFMNQSKWMESEMMFQWALQEREEQLGPKHKITLQITNGLADL